MVQSYEEKVKDFWLKRIIEPKYLWEDLHDQDLIHIRKYVHGSCRILDLGCGDGSLSNALYFPYMKITAVDYMNCYKHFDGYDNVTFHCCDILKFESQEKYDIILLVGVLQYFTDENVKILLAKCHKMLNNDGVIFVRHQRSLAERSITVDEFSEKLKTNYLSIYRTIQEEEELFNFSGFAFNRRESYPEQFNKWKNTQFIYSEYRKNKRLDLKRQMSNEELEYGNNQWLKTLNYTRISQVLDMKSSQDCLFALKKVFDEINIKFLLVYGTLLGAIRENNFITTDVDVDVAVLVKDTDNIIEAFRKIPYKILRVESVLNDASGDLIISIGNETSYLDIALYVDNFNGEYEYHDGKTKWNIKYEDFDSNDIVKFLGQDFAVPKNPTNYLEKWYGDWRTPVKRR